MKLSKGAAITLLIAGLLVIDQIIKVAVKLNMAIGDSIFVFGQEWFQICFTENSGFAFGMQFGGDIGKIILTLFRLVLIGLIIYFIKKRLLRDREVSTGVLVGGLSRFGGGYRKCHRLPLLREAFQRIDMVRCRDLFARRWGICSFADGKSGGYVLLSHNRYHTARMGAFQRRGAFHLFQGDIQFRRCLYFCWSRISASFPAQESFQVFRTSLKIKWL